MQVDIEYLLIVALVFTGYLIMSESEDLLIHCLYDALKAMLLTILEQFLKPDLLKGIFMADMCMMTWRKRIIISP